MPYILDFILITFLILTIVAFIVQAHADINQNEMNIKLDKINIKEDDSK